MCLTFQKYVLNGWTVKMIFENDQSSFQSSFCLTKICRAVRDSQWGIFRDFDLIVDLFVRYSCNIFWIFYLLLVLHSWIFVLKSLNCKHLYTSIELIQADFLKVISPFCFQYSLDNFCSMHFVKACTNLGINIFKDKGFSSKYDKVHVL